jgi:lysylphosphatidylglycerol synthetase-like protein (DUF2156 family)
MKDNNRNGILRRAIAVAILLTATMALCGTVANLVKPLSWLRYVAQVIAFPPSLIVRHLIAVSGNSLMGVVAIELGGVAITFVFYTLLVALVLWLLTRRSEPSDKRRK